MDRRLLPNPFQNDVVTSPDQALETDVPEIHRQPFELCRKTYETVARERVSASLLLHGEAGCGKTHLLSRFRRWLTAANGDSRPGMPPAVFVAIRMETAPNQIWMHVRRRFSEELTRRSADGRCPLDGILGRLVERYGGSLSDALESADIRDLGIDLENVLVHFAGGRHRRLCRAWLAGDGLSDADLQSINLSATRIEEAEEDFSETSSRRVVLSLVRLSEPRPVVFCFDQVEALGISQHGVRSFAPFNRMGAALIDETANVLFVSTILTTFLRDLQDQNMRSDYQRISKHLMDLQPLDLTQGRKLIDSRLALFPELRGEDPIPEAELGAFYSRQHGYANARKLIHEARIFFAEWQHTELPDPPSVTGLLEVELERLWAGAEVRSETAQADVVLAHGLPAALELLGHQATSTDTGLTIQHGGSPLHVVFLNQSNARSLAATIKRLLDRRLPLASLCMIRDHRLPIPPTATATIERLVQIEDGGGRLVRVEAEALAALHALRQLLTEATSGELSLNGEAVNAETVRDWLARNMPPVVERLAAEILDEEAPDEEAANADVLIELIGRRKIVPVDEAVQLTGRPPEEIEEYARTHPLHIRWFGGPRPVVCEAMAASAAQETEHA